MASGVADGMVLCLFDEAGAETPAPLRDYDHGVWHAFVPGIAEGQAYGYRATGPYDPARGVRCHPAKLLLDPYARAISGSVTFGPEVLTDMPSGIRLHVKGFTMRHPELPPELRGTYAGLGHHAAIARLLALEVTAVELLPVHESVPESFLLQRGLTNYWATTRSARPDAVLPRPGQSRVLPAGRWRPEARRI